MHVVGLPMGARLRLRYRRPYVSRRLWAHVAHGRSIEGDLALIALGATKSSGESVVKPVRLAEIIGASCEGSVLVVDVSLSSFVSERECSENFWNGLKRHAPGLPDSFNYVPGSTASYLERLSLDLNNLIISEEIAGWEAAAASFFEVDSVCCLGSGGTSRMVPFLFYVTGLGAGVKRRLRETGCIILEAGRGLSVEVHTLAAPGADALKDPLGEVCFELSHPAASFESSRRVRIDSRRDVRFVKMTTSALFRTIGGHLSIRSISFCNSPSSDGKACAGLTSAKKREELALARYDIPMRVGRVMPWIASLLVSGAAAAASYKVPQTKTESGAEFVLPAIVFVLAFSGLVLGLKSEKK